MGARPGCRPARSSWSAWPAGLATGVDRPPGCAWCRPADRRVLALRRVASIETGSARRRSRSGPRFQAGWIPGPPVHPQVRCVAVRQPGRLGCPCAARQSARPALPRQPGDTAGSGGRTGAGADAAAGAGVMSSLRGSVGGGGGPGREQPGVGIGRRSSGSTARDEGSNPPAVSSVSTSSETAAMPFHETLLARAWVTLGMPDSPSSGVIAFASSTAGRCGSSPGLSVLMAGSLGLPWPGAEVRSSARGARPPRWCRRSAAGHRHRRPRSTRRRQPSRRAASGGG